MNWSVEWNSWMCEKIEVFVKYLDKECENGRLEEDFKGVNR